jgi:hypothetical protein
LSGPNDDGIAFGAIMSTATPPCASSDLIGAAASGDSVTSATRAAFLITENA